jgi:hypothetical protein
LTWKKILPYTSQEKKRILIKIKYQKSKKLSKMSKEDADFELVRAALLRAVTRIHVAEKS